VKNSVVVGVQIKDSRANNNWILQITNMSGVFKEDCLKYL